MERRSVQTQVLAHVNYKVMVAGYPSPFLTKDMRFDTVNGILFIKAPDTVPFYETDDIEVKVLDLEIPAILRAQMKEEGWLTLTMGEFINILHLDSIQD